jgi:hypothetical protein
MLSHCHIYVFTALQSVEHGIDVPAVDIYGRRACPQQPASLLCQSDYILRIRVNIYNTTYIYLIFLIHQDFLLPAGAAAAYVRAREMCYACMASG